ncbi:MAG: LOG family protein [Nanoarchaeota archaeon]|nr:LOG family protein [Nanoarchaeota archaeon]
MKYKICVSGAAETSHCQKGSLEKAKEIGREIVRQNGILVTGATTGIPYWAAIGAKEEGGVVFGLSPAASKAAHVKTYHLPTDYHDVIIYTGFEYAGRNLILTRSSDAVIVICGRIGTLNEFTIAFEDNKPIGVLIGTGGTADLIKRIVRDSHRGLGRIVYDSDPPKLVSKVIKLINKEKI